MCLAQKQLPIDDTTLTAQKIVNNAIKFHDPNSSWSSLHANFHFQSCFKHNPFSPENLEVEINVPENKFKYSNIERDFAAVYRKDTCETISSVGNCNNYSWTKNFYTYVWRLPMKLQDPGTAIDSVFSIEKLSNDNCYKIAVNYPNENFNFYFKCSNFELHAFSFLKNDSSGHGEFVEMKGTFSFKEIKSPQKRTWKDIHTRDTLGTNTVTNIETRPEFN